MKKGGILLHQTDTIPGLAAIATFPDSIAKIFQIKGRQEEKSLILLFPALDMASAFMQPIPSDTANLFSLADPHPLTIVIPITQIKSEFGIVSKERTIAFRIPHDKKLREFILACGSPLVSTSANISGEPAPQKMQEVSAQIRSHVDFILESEQDEFKDPSPSTIIKLGNGNLSLIRPGPAWEKLSRRAL